MLGAKMSIADLALFGLVHSVKTGTYDYVPADALDAWSKVVGAYSAALAHPLVAEEIAAK